MLKNLRVHTYRTVRKVRSNFRKIMAIEQFQITLKLHDIARVIEKKRVGICSIIISAFGLNSN